MSEPCQVGYVDRLGGVLRAEFDPMYGPAVRRKRVARSGGCGLASMYPAFGWSACSRPSWISARVRSHYRTGLRGPFGSPVFARAGKTDPPSRDATACRHAQEARI